MLSASFLSLSLSDSAELRFIVEMTKTAPMKNHTKALLTAILIEFHNSFFSFFP